MARAASARPLFPRFCIVLIRQRVLRNFFPRRVRKFLIVKHFEHTYALAQIRTCLWPQHKSEGEPPGKIPDASKDERLKATT